MKIIIIGGGIAGMYTAYKLLHKNKKNIMLFEADNYLGGRIFTYRTKLHDQIKWEAGAGRFTKNMHLLIQLMKDLGLYKDIALVPSSTNYLDSDLINHDLQASDLTKRYNARFSEMVNNVIHQCISEINTTYTKKILQKHTLIQLLNKHYDKDIVNLIIDSYGYYSELAIMNAYDAIRLYHDMNDQEFYILKGGLSQIIERLYSVISKYISIELNSKLQTVTFNQNSITVTVNKKHYTCDKLVLAIPKNSLINVRFVNNHIPKYLLNSISCQPLLRIYCIYPKHNNRVWFHNLPKTTTNNVLKYIIPIDKSKGIIMISYTDSIFTKIWKKHSNNFNNIKNLIASSLSELFPNTHIPEPLLIKCHYWDCGCGYWLPNIDSKTTAKKMLRPIPSKSLYVCGENYSLQQAWMEGALSTAEKISKML